MLTEQQREYLLPKAYNAALRAGAAILEIYTHNELYAIDIKSDLTPITLADRESHNIIKSYLGQTRIPLLSEEGREMLYQERIGWDLFWIVDPLDGTKEFIKGNGEFTVNIALMADNEPVISVIYVPFKKLIYFSDKALGAFRKADIASDAEAEHTFIDIIREAQRLPIKAERNNPIRIAVSRSHNNQNTFDHIERVKQHFHDAVVFEQGSSFKLCLIAEGTAEYYVRTSETYEWDTAAGQLIIEQAGGSLTSLDNQKLLYNKTSLLNPHFVCMSKFMPI